jgi:hypothetical protein
MSALVPKIYVSEIPVFFSVNFISFSAEDKGLGDVLVEMMSVCCLFFNHSA